MVQEHSRHNLQFREVFSTGPAHLEGRPTSLRFPRAERKKCEKLMRNVGHHNLIFMTDQQICSLLPLFQVATTLSNSFFALNAIILKRIPFQFHSLFQFGLLAPYNVQNATARVESHFGEPSQGNLAGQQGRLLKNVKHSISRCCCKFYQSSPLMISLLLLFFRQFNR